MTTSATVANAATDAAIGRHDPLGSVRHRRLAPFVLAAAAGLASVVLTLPPKRLEWTLAAFIIAIAVFAGSALLPWGRWPRAWQAVPPLISLAIVAALRHGAGGADSGYGPLAMIPVLWLALYGSRIQLTLALAGCALLFAVPIIVAGAPEYPAGEWRRSLLFVGTAAMVGYVVQNLLASLRERDAALTAMGAELERSNLELQQFASVAAHDLQEPLRKIQAFGDRLDRQAGASLDASGRDSLERMRGAAARMQELITDLLTYSRVATRREPARPVDLGKVTTAVLADLETRIQETGGTVTVGALPTIDADPRQMQQLFQNLVGNALKFHRPDVPPEVHITAPASETSDVVIEVADNGIGFEEAYADRIFAPFQRLHGRAEFEGTGMGLAICRRIAERHGGSISVRSEVGTGTVFNVRLPRRQAGEVA